MIIIVHEIRAKKSPLVVKLLLKQRVNSLECQNYAGMTPIYLAAQHKQIKIFKLYMLNFSTRMVK
jgi:ankyrin repeat protein